MQEYPRPMDLALYALWCFAVAVVGGLVGLVLGRLSERQLVRSIAVVLLVAGLATAVEAVA
jgi:hypothetical protein